MRSEAEKQIREALAAGPTPGPWHHCHPFQSVRAERTIHGPVPAQRVDFVSTKTQPVHERIIIPMAGREAHVRSEDMAFIAACNPENITALLVEIDRLRAALQHESDCVEAAKAEIDRLTCENAQLAEFVEAVGGFWGHTKSVLVGPESLAEAINGMAEENLRLTRERNEAQAGRAPHYCEMDHAPIRHWDSENELCPLCRMRDERDEARAERDALLEVAQAIEGALRFAPAAEVLDEHSPIRDGLRAALAQAKEGS